MTAKKQYKQVGKILFIFALVVCGLQIILSILDAFLFSNSFSNYNTILDWILSFAPIYLIGFPISILLFKRLPVDKTQPQKLTIGRFIILFIECIALVYIGNIIGTVLSLLLSKGQAINPVVEVTSNISIIQVLVTTIIAPIIEEIMFRKLIIDHTVMYGEKVAIIYSALAFALFHMNLYQFFYALAVGLIFGYIYVKTRSIRYSIIIHIIINFFGGVIAPFIVSSVNVDVLQNIEMLSEAEIIKFIIPVLILFVYLLVLLGFVIAGLVLFIINVRKISFNHTELDIPRGHAFKIAYLNVYYILFFIICLIYIILALIV